MSDMNILWLIENHLMNPNNPRSRVLLECRQHDLCGFGLNSRTLEQTGKLMGVSRGAASVIVKKEQRRIRDNINRLILRSQEKVKIVEVDRVVRVQEIETILSIRALDLTVRSQNCLSYMGVETVEQLCKKKYSELLLFPNMGRKSANEIVEQLSRLGLSLKGESCNQ